MITLILRIFSLVALRLYQQIDHVLKKESRPLLLLLSDSMGSTCSSVDCLSV